jgi:hypothetical protein
VVIVRDAQLTTSIVYVRVAEHKPGMLAMMSKVNIPVWPTELAVSAPAELKDIPAGSWPV